MIFDKVIRYTSGMSFGKTVYFVRHGQSEANIGSVFQPLDSPLTPEGREQARKIAERASRIPFDALICSPLVRTKQTSEFITERTGKEPEHSELFVEWIKPTGLGGESRSDPAARKLWEEWGESLHTPGLRVADGENFDDLIVRTDRALGFLEERPEERILVVTHAQFLRNLFARVLLGNSLTGEAFKEFRSKLEMENTGLSVLKYGKRSSGTGWYVWVYNDHAHLG
jgi:probable phosphoglycerate mutase